MFNDVVAGHLRGVDFMDDEYPWLVGLPVYRTAPCRRRPTPRIGQPLFADGGARIEDVLSMFRAGEPLDVVRDEYGVPLEQLEGRGQGRDSYGGLMDGFGHPGGLPEPFLDRSLGRRQVPDRLREKGLVLRTLAEVDGISSAPDVPDDSALYRREGPHPARQRPRAR